MTDKPKDDDLNDLIPPWLQTYLEELSSVDRDSFIREYRDGILDLIKRLESLPMNRFEDGKDRVTLSVRIPGTKMFVNLKSSLWAAVKYGGPMLLASAIATPLVAILGITVGAPATLASIGSAGAALYDAFAKLNSIEMDTYLAVAAAIERNMNKKRGNTRVSLAQILQSFKKDDELSKPHDLEAMLKNLVDKKVLILALNKTTGAQEYFLAY